MNCVNSWALIFFFFFFSSLYLGGRIDMPVKWNTGRCCNKNTYTLQFISRFVYAPEPYEALLGCEVKDGKAGDYIVKGSLLEVSLKRKAVRIAVQTDP